jgi:hypothetical protein
MNTTSAPHGPGRLPRQLRRRSRFLLLAAGLAAVLLASACDTAQQVPWASYSTGLQTHIDAATATGNCATLQALLTAAMNTSHAHEKATGFPNDALVSYIQAAQARAGCPAGSG